jgi:hypothetical protein
MGNNGGPNKHPSSLTNILDDPKKGPQNSDPAGKFEVL